MSATEGHTRPLSKGHMGIIACLEYFQIENPAHLADSQFEAISSVCRSHPHI